MTVGQRIMRKRKELGLSQESLGEQLGVSRQAIYKWESDTSLPEIEKLIALSRIFGVSVGWLLCVEESPCPESTEADAAPSELTESQLLMVQEIVDRYLAARDSAEKKEGDTAKAQETQPPKRRRWPRVLAVCAAAALIITLFSLSERLKSLNNQYQYLQATISNVQEGVSIQISSITGRVEEILKSQNDLTADYKTELLSVDPGTETVSFSYRAIPKTYSDGMTAWIDVVSGGEHNTIGPFNAERETFSGKFSAKLTDDIVIYIVFELDGVRQTQLLDTYKDLLRNSFPHPYLNTWPLHMDIDDDTNTLEEDLYANIEEIDRYEHEAEIESYRIGLFADRELVEWFTPTTRKYILNGVETFEDTFILKKDSITLDTEREYCIAAIVIDEYGREFVISDTPAYRDESGWYPVSSYSAGPLFEGWTY